MSRTLVAIINGIPPYNAGRWWIVRPLVRFLGGEPVAEDGLGDERERRAHLEVSVPSRPGREDFVPCTLASDGEGGLRATPIFGRPA